MQSRLRRRRLLPDNLQVTPAAESARAGVSATTTVSSGEVQIPPEFTPHQYAIFLLHIAAEIEHVLMVQYLYAGFSLGGAQVPTEHQREVAEWRDIILGIAKEEMGHLMTVQNLLRSLGGALNFDREDYPWDSAFFPFPFELEPVTKLSLAKYIFTEAPDDTIWKGREADEIRNMAREGVNGASLHRVGELYEIIQKLLADPTAVPDSAFRGSTFPFQANWDEWGRGYKAGARGNSTTPPPVPGAPDVLLLPVVSRSDAVAAVNAISTQGEATSTAADGALSHFARFLRIFRQFPSDGSWTPARNVASNPSVSASATVSSAQGEGAGSAITHPEAVLWAHLFNVRYRLLLTDLLHTFDYPNNVTAESQLTPRGFLLHAAFGEMYNVRALSQVLMELPLSKVPGELRAGPPFQMPFSLNLPVDAPDRWQLHAELLRSSSSLAARLQKEFPSSRPEYLVALLEADKQQLALISALLSGAPMPLPKSNRYH